MRSTKIKVDNLKCGGCANTILKKMSDLSGVKKVDVDIDLSEITVDYNDSIVSSESLITKLSSLGYPQAGTTNTMQKARSYVSCAIGKIRW